MIQQTRMNTRTAGLFSFLLLAFVPAQAQKREDILSMQRDIAQLQDQVTQMRAEQNQKLDALTGMLKQAIEDNARLSQAMTAFERTTNERMALQQSKVDSAVAPLGTKVDQVSDEVRVVRENVTDLSAKMGNLDNKLSDISSAIRTLSTPAVVPPPPGSPGTTPGASNNGPQAPAGVSAETLWENANRDRLSGKDELAMNEYNDFVKYFPQSENAPAAQYYIGDTYWRGKQYSDAAQAFDAVLERFPENPKTPDALYMKGAALMAANRKTDAAIEFKDFLARYPSHSLAPKAQLHLRELGLTPTPAPRSRKK